MSDAPPPAYEDATQSKQSSTGRPTTHSSSYSSHLDVPRNGIPTLHRRSMEDEGRPLPLGWIRQFDAKESHQYFVDTNVTPARSIWHHPYDDDQYLSTLTSEERESLQSTSSMMKPSKADMAADSSADESDSGHHPSKPPPPSASATATGPSSSSFPHDLPDRPNGPATPPHSETGGLNKLGRKVKDALTASTHEERERQRAGRARDEQEAYARYRHLRAAMTQAAQTGQPQLLGQNAAGQDVYMEPPRTDGYGDLVYPGGGGYGASAGGGAAAGGSYQAYNPYTQGPYANPDNRFVAYPRPNYAYGRPYGYGYGGGMGMPLMGGMLGGMMLGGVLF